MTDQIVFDAPDLPDFPDAIVSVAALGSEGLKVRYMLQEGMEQGHRLSLYLGGQLPVKSYITTDPEQYVFMPKSMFENYIGRGFDLFYRVWNGTAIVGISKDLPIWIRA